VHCESRVAVAVAQGDCENPQEEECPPLEAGTRARHSRPGRLGACSNELWSVRIGDSASANCN
jgi:hypothetical protein